MSNIDFPKSISVNLPVDKMVTPFAAKIPENTLNGILNLSFKGLVNADGTFNQKPGIGWVSQKTGTGTYKIIHNVGKLNTTLSVFLLAQPGSFQVQEHHKDYFVVATLLDKQATDLPVGFVLSPVISA